MFKKIINRRNFIIVTLGGFLSAVLGPVTRRLAVAMGNLPAEQGMRKIEGTVKINGQPAQIGSLLKSGDVVTTGSDSMAVFVVGTSAFLVREKSRFEVTITSDGDSNIGSVDALDMIEGKIMWVLRKKSRRITTPTAVVGVRGTGIYIEAGQEKTYVCTCYGTTDLSAKAVPSVNEKIKTSYHESPRYIYRGKIETAPVINHTDKELIMLESLVRRKPPFLTSDGKNKGGGDY